MLPMTTRHLALFNPVNLVVYAALILMVCLAVSVKLPVPKSMNRCAAVMTTLMTIHVYWQWLDVRPRGTYIEDTLDSVVSWPFEF